MKPPHLMLEKAPCGVCEEPRGRSKGPRRSVLVRDACEVCLGRGEVFAFTLDDMQKDTSHRCGGLLLYKDEDGNVEGRFDEWLPDSWQPIECEAGLQSMLWSCAAHFAAGRSYAR